MSDLPEGWVWARLEDLVLEKKDITDGPFGSNLKTAHYTETGPRVIRLQNIGDGRFVDERAHIAQDHFEALEKHHVAAGDVLVASLGEELPRACVAPPSLGPALVKADCIRVRPAPGVSPSYLMHALNAPQTRERVASEIKGVGRPRINLSDLRSLNLPVPPSDEQVRIVAELERRQAHLTRVSHGLVKAASLIGLARRSVINAALTGGSSLTQAGAAVAELSNHAMTDPELPALPSGWVWVRLADLLAEPLRNGRSAPTASDERGVSTFTITAVTRRDFGSHHTKMAVGDPHDLRDLFARDGDIFVQRSNTPELVGSAALYRGPSDRAVFPDLLIRVRVGRHVLPEWVELTFRWDRTRSLLRSKASGLAGSMPKIDQTKVASVPIPVPPLSEQIARVAEAERRLSVIDTVEAAVWASDRKVNRARRALLAAAFEGRLVAQNPDEAPASELLAGLEIDGERASTTSPKRKKKETVA